MKVKLFILMTVAMVSASVGYVAAMYFTTETRSEVYLSQIEHQSENINTDDEEEDLKMIYENISFWTPYVRRMNYKSGEYNLRYSLDIVPDYNFLLPNQNTNPNNFSGVRLVLQDRYNGEIVNENLFSLLPKDQIDKSGLPLPISITENDEIIFGGRNYEGTIGNFYKYDFDSNSLINIENLSLENVRRYSLLSENISPGGEYALYAGVDENMIIFDFTNESYIEVNLTPDEGETFLKECGMGCYTEGGWVSENTFWYAVYEEVRKNDKRMPYSGKLLDVRKYSLGD